MAMGLRAELAIADSAVVVADSDLSRIPEVFELARRTMRVVRQKLFLGFLLNAAGITLGVTDLLICGRSGVPFHLRGRRPCTSSQSLLASME